MGLVVSTLSSPDISGLQAPLTLNLSVVCVHPPTPTLGEAEIHILLLSVTSSQENWLFFCNVREHDFCLHGVRCGVIKFVCSCFQLLEWEWERISLGQLTGNSPGFYSESLF